MLLGVVWVPRVRWRVVLRMGWASGVIFAEHGCTSVKLRWMHATRHVRIVQPRRHMHWHVR